VVRAKEESLIQEAVVEVWEEEALVSQQPAIQLLMEAMEDLVEVAVEQRILRQLVMEGLEEEEEQQKEEEVEDLAGVEVVASLQLHSLARAVLQAEMDLVLH
jgi:hypothetical protein